MIVNTLDYVELQDFLRPILRLESPDAIGRECEAILRISPEALAAPLGPRLGVKLRYKSYELFVKHFRWFDTKGMAVHLVFRTRKKWWHEVFKGFRSPISSAWWIGCEPRKKWWHEVFKDPNAELVGDLMRICAGEISGLHAGEITDLQFLDRTLQGGTITREPVDLLIFHDAAAFNEKWDYLWDASPLIIAPEIHHGWCHVSFHFWGGGYERCCEVNEEREHGDHAPDNVKTRLRRNWLDFAFDVSRDLAQWAGLPEEKAIADCTEAIRLNPKEADAYFTRGSAYEKKGDYEKAIADYTEAIRLDPKSAVSCVGRAVAYLGKRDWDKAVSDCTEAIRRDPKCDIAYGARGDAYAGKSDWDKAFSDRTEVIRLWPNAAAYHNRGLVCYYKGNYEKAIADYTEAIRLNPKGSGESYYCRGLAYLEKGEHLTAKLDFAQAERLGCKPQQERRPYT